MTDDLAERQSAIDFSLNSTIGSSVTENVQYFYGNKERAMFIAALKYERFSAANQSPSLVRSIYGSLFLRVGDNDSFRRLHVAQALLWVLSIILVVETYRSLANDSINFNVMCLKEAADSTRCDFYARHCFSRNIFRRVFAGSIGQSIVVWYFLFRGFDDFKSLKSPTSLPEIKYYWNLRTSLSITSLVLVYDVFFLVHSSWNIAKYSDRRVFLPFADNENLLQTSYPLNAAIAALAVLLNVHAIFSIVLFRHFIATDPICRAVYGAVIVTFVQNIAFTISYLVGFADDDVAFIIFFLISFAASACMIYISETVRGRSFKLSSAAAIPLYALPQILIFFVSFTRSNGSYMAVLYGFFTALSITFQWLMYAFPTSDQMDIFSSTLMEWTLTPRSAAVQRAFNILAFMTFAAAGVIVLLEISDIDLRNTRCAIR